MKCLDRTHYLREIELRSIDLNHKLFLYMRIEFTSRNEVKDQTLLDSWVEEVLKSNNKGALR